MIEPNVPKPSSSFVPIADDNCDVAGVDNHAPKGDDSGTDSRQRMGLDDPTEDACTLARRAGSESAARLGPNLGRRELVRLVTVFRRTLLPRRPPARKRKESITAAHQDWKNGVRGVILYRTHILTGRSITATGVNAKRVPLWKLYGLVRDVNGNLKPSESLRTHVPHCRRVRTFLRLAEILKHMSEATTWPHTGQWASS